MTQRLRIAQVAPPLERVPPKAYGGTERVMDELIRELDRRGHEVTTFASGDSEVPGRHIVTVPEALRPSGFGGDAYGWFLQTLELVRRQAKDFDLIHSHLEWSSIALAHSTDVPVISTFHGRLDLPWAADLLAGRPQGLVAISRSHASMHPTVPFTIIPNGLSLESMPFERRRTDDLVFVGRVAPEKGIVDAIEVARLSGRRIRIAAKVGTLPAEVEYYEQVFKPAMATADVEFLGELEGPDRDRLISQSYAMVLPANWPEPFGLVAIEALASGTPIVARRVGAFPEIIREGIDGFFGDDPSHLAYLLPRVEGLDRGQIRASVLDRFSAKRMVDRYEALYAKRLGDERSDREAVDEPIAATEQAIPAPQPAPTRVAVQMGEGLAGATGRLGIREKASNGEPSGTRRN